MKKQSITSAIPVVKRKLRSPFNDKPASYVYVPGKGIFKWNTVFKVYNNKDNYAQLMQDDVHKIDWYKSGN
jgi:hypothetical protein